MRARRAYLEEEAEQGKRSAALAVQISDDLSRYLSACQLGITLTSLAIGFLGEPAVASLFEDLIGDSVPARRLARHLASALAYLITTSLHITIGEQVPKIWAIQTAERARAARGAAAVPLRPHLPSLHRRPQRRLQRDPPRDGREDRGRAGGGRDAGGAQGPDPAVADRRQARPGRGGHAHGRLPPPRAGGAPGDDAGAGRRDRGHVRGRRDRPAPLRVLRAHAPRGHGGREPRPREGHRARQRARPAAA